VASAKNGDEALPLTDDEEDLIDLYDRYFIKFVEDDSLELPLKDQTLTPKSDSLILSPQSKSPDFDPKIANLPENEKDVILVFHSTYDPNKAFDHDGDKGLFTILKGFKHYSFQYHKISDLSGIRRVVDNLGPKQKIAHLIIMAHGLKDRFVLSPTQWVSKSNGALRNLVQIIEPKLTSYCSILLHSCLVGKGGPGANNLATEFCRHLRNHTIFASEESIKRGDLLVVLAKEDYRKGILNMDYEIDSSQKYKLHKFLC